MRLFGRHRGKSAGIGRSVKVRTREENRDAPGGFFWSRADVLRLISVAPFVGASSALADDGGGAATGARLDDFARLPFATVSAFISSTSAARGAGSIWLADVFQFIEAPEGAGDGHVTNAAGVEFYARPMMGCLSPIQFGAAWDGVTDDTDAIHACVANCRDTYCRMSLPPGKGYAADTIFLGGVDVAGAGNARAGGAGWALRSSSILLVGGQPGIVKGKAGEAKVGGGRWSDFEVVSTMAVGAMTTPIDLWDRLAYPYQIGVAIGRNMLELSSGDAIADGTGWGTIENVSFRGFGGWGLYGHMCWGLSTFRNCTFHECGGPAAVALGDRNGGAMIFDNVGVDWNVSEVHGVNWGYGPTSPYTRRGTFLRMGSFKADIEALDRFWRTGGNDNLTGLHAEGWTVALDVRGGNDLKFDNLKLEGLHVYLGDTGNSAAEPRIHLGRWSTYSLEGGFLTLHVNNTATTDLGLYQGFQSNQSIIIKYKGTVELDFSGAASVRHNFTPRPSLDTAVIPVPDWDATGSPSGSSNFVPWMRTRNTITPTEDDNLLPVITNPVAAPYVFGGIGGVQTRVDSRTVLIARGEEALGQFAEIAATVPGLTPGALHSFAFRLKMYSADLEWPLVTFGLRGDLESGSTVSRKISQFDADLGGVQPGTVSITTGETIVTGSETDGFTIKVRTGDRVRLGGGWYMVAHVTTDALTLATPFRGPTLSGAAWEWEGGSEYTSRICNFVAPPNGAVDVFVRNGGYRSVYVSDLTVVRGFLVDFPII